MTENIICSGERERVSPPGTPRPPLPEILHFKIAPPENEGGVFQLSSGEDGLNLH